MMVAPIFFKQAPDDGVSTSLTTVICHLYQVLSDSKAGTLHPEFKQILNIISFAVITHLNFKSHTFFPDDQ